MDDLIPYGREQVTNEDIQSVIEVLRSDYLTQGKIVPEFEKAVSKNCEVKYAVAVNSATSALHIACLALGVGKGDTVWTSPNSFVASANCALYCGASVDFVDIDANTWCMSIDQLQKKLEFSQKMKFPLPKVVIPVHLSGQACEMEKIAKLGEQYKFRIIEDASHAIGGYYQNEPVGNCRFSDITVFSFHPVKIITTGEGGMAMTNNSDLHKKMEQLRTHGITRNPEQMTYTPTGPWYYEQVELGYNYRLTDIQAALGLSQLERMGAFVERRYKLAQRYVDSLEKQPIQLQYLPKNVSSANHLFIIRVQGDLRFQLFEYMRKNNVGVNVHYIPIHLQPYYRNLGFEEGNYQESEDYGNEAVTLPIYPNLSDHAQDKIIKLFKMFIVERYAFFKK